jgi:NADPH:quinone reductase-like Zn-dependent oxidoreductase
MEANTMSKTKMQAILVHEYGGSDVLKLEEVDIPTPLSGEVLVKIHYATVIPLDWKTRNGWLQAVFPKTLPYIPGFYASGIIESAGPGVTTFTAGDRVFGMVDGAYSEFGIASGIVGGTDAKYSMAPVNELVKMPDGLSFEDAASIRAGADAAWKALFTEGELEAGQTVLIHAAAGGVGQFAVQLAKWKGANVIGTASTSNLAFVKSLGADQVIDYTTTAFEDVVKDVDLVVDSVGGDTEDRSWAVLKNGGILVSLTQPPSQEIAQKLGITAKFNTKFPTYANLQTIAQLIADGTIQAEIDNIFPLSQADKALEKSEASHGRGRILLRIAILTDSIPNAIHA